MGPAAAQLASTCQLQLTGSPHVSALTFTAGAAPAQASKPTPAKRGGRPREKKSYDDLIVSARQLAPGGALVVWHHQACATARCCVWALEAATVAVHAVAAALSPQPPPAHSDASSGPQPAT